MRLEDYDGVSLEDLVFRDIAWDDDARSHVEQRNERKGSTEFAPRAEWATEACQDPGRVLYRVGSALVVVGNSPTAQRLLRVVVRPAGHANEGAWVGLTAHAAPARDRRRYEETP